MSLPICIDSESISAYVRPVENFLDRIYNRSKRNNGKNIFSRLAKALTWPRLIVCAALKVLANSGSYTPGVDSVTKGIFMRTFEKQVEIIKEMIKKGYRPGDVLRVYIPKPNGDKRPLGIAILRDRIIQEMYRMILEAIYEPHFLPESHGFRIGRSTQDCLKDCMSYVQPNKKMYYVLEFDIKKFFDNMEHKITYKLLGWKIKDHSFKVGIWRFMRARILDDGKLMPCKKGVCQGGVVSPILANIYLHEFDKYIMQTLRCKYATPITRIIKTKGSHYAVNGVRRKSNGGTLSYVRYADDSVAFWNGRLKQLHQIKDECRQFLADTLKLEMSEEKTKITAVKDGFKFVGYHIRKTTTSKRHDSGVVDIPKDTISKTKKKITALLRECTVKGYELAFVIIALNQILCAFYNYYKNTSFRTSKFAGMFWHAKAQFFYYLKRRNLRPIQFLAHVAGWLTYRFGKRYLFPPSRITKHKCKTTFHKINKNLLTTQGKKEETSRFPSRKRRFIVKRLFPNDPLVPLYENWRETRQAVLKRDHGKCVFCGKPATQVDHTLTKAEAKCDKRIAKIRDQKRFLRSLCTSCHYKRHGQKWSWNSVMEFIDKFNHVGGCNVSSHNA